MNRSILLVAHTAHAHFDALDEVLVELAYEVEPVAPAEWVGLGEAASGRISVVYFDADHLAETERVLRDPAPGPRLFVTRGASIPPDRLPPGSDAVSWPCREYELAFRIERLAAHHLDDRSDPEVGEAVERFRALGLVGRSRPFLELLRRAWHTVRANAPVLVSGATGTGKELVARAVHDLGPRASRPWLPVNCAALPDGLLENELFGHARGAFTDARTASAGLVAEADGGTLFLDEVEALSPRAQGVLLRFLDRQEYRPLGGGPPRRVDVRVISATNRELKDLVDEGSFRSDLRYRLEVLTVEVPALAERAGDVELLARYFMRRFSGQYDLPRELGPRALAALTAHVWPGNVRELENVLHRSFVYASRDVLDAEDLLIDSDPRVRSPQWIRFEAPFQEAKAEAVSSFEHRYLDWLMIESGGNVTEASRRAGKERRALGKLLKKHGLDHTDYRRLA